MNLAAGLSHSSAPFSQYAERIEEEGVEKLPRNNEEEVSLSSATVLDHPPSPAGQGLAKKRPTSKKQKPKAKKLSFEECLIEVRMLASEQWVCF